MLAVLATFALGLAVGPTALQAQAPYEPNDALSAAAGPLLNGQPLVATLESTSDADFFFFYVAPANSGQSFLTVSNLGGSDQPTAEINARIVDSLGTQAEGNFDYIRKGESRTSPVALDPGKYFIEVLTREGQGDSYQLTAGGNGGAFGQYAPIAARCASATASLDALQRGLERARTKLQRAVNRVQRSRYGSRESRQAARARHRQAKALVTAKKRAVKAAAQARSPWCFIPQ